VLHLYLYGVRCLNIGTSNDPFLTQVSNFAVLFGNELDAEVYQFIFSFSIDRYFKHFSLTPQFLQVLSMSMDLFIARTMITKASLVFRGRIPITESQVWF
jgi:endoribonuclease Dicer